MIPKSPTVKLLAFVAAAFAAGLFAVPRAGAADPSPAPATASVIRQEMLAEYQYTPPGAKTAPLPTSLQSNAPPIFTFTTPPDVVKMEAFEVQESGSGSKGALLAPADIRVTAPSVASKLGIAIHTKDVGKVRFFAATLFYVPFLVGFAW
jgi:hypothetical protein